MPARGFQTAGRWAAFLALAGLGLLFLLAVRAVLTPFLLAVILTYILAPAVNYLHRLGLGRSWAILLIYALLGLMGGLALVYLIPVLADELDALRENVPRFTTQVQELARALQADYSRVGLPSSIRTVIDDAIAGGERRLLDLLGAAAGAIPALISGLVSVALAPVLAFYILSDLERFKLQGMRLVPRSVRSEVLALAGQLDEVLSGFVRGMILVAVAVGIMVAAAMTILGMRFVLLLGLIAGVAEFIPYFGPVLGALPALALALLISPAMTVKVLVAFIIIQQVENALIAPRIMGSKVGLHPLVVIFALLAGGRLYGFFGLLLAVPATAVAKVLFAFIGRKLGNRDMEMTRLSPRRLTRWPPGNGKPARFIEKKKVPRS